MEDEKAKKVKKKTRVSNRRTAKTARDTSIYAPKYVSEDKIAEALKAFKGKQYLTARALGLNHSSVSRRIDSSPRLQEIIRECDEVNIDTAELKLYELNEEKNLGSIVFLLKTKGKQRGFIESNQIDVTPETLDSFKAVMQQMKEMQSKEA